MVELSIFQFFFALCLFQLVFDSFITHGKGTRVTFTIWFFGNILYNVQFMLRG